MQFHLEGRGLMWKLLGDEKFRDFKYTLDNVMKQRNSQLVGYGVRKAEVLSPIDQDILWSIGISGIDYPDQLLSTVVFTIGLSCTLTAGQEHRKLHSIPFRSQFSWHVGDD